MYVAGFIGSPRMNLVPVTVSGSTAKASGFSLELPRAPGIEKAVLGLRPEDLTDVPHEGFPQIEMTVEVVEVLGSDQFLYGKVGGDEVIARLDPQFKVAVRDKVRLHVNMRRLHLFDVKTERAVL
jgi:ABC-type sugar transport system ATPase subunit